MTFEKFKGLFDGLTPDEYSNQISKFQEYLEKLTDDFYKEYTYCTGCKRLVKKSEKHIEQAKSKRFIRCNQCNTIWYIRYNYEPIEEELD